MSAATAEDGWSTGTPFLQSEDTRTAPVATQNQVPKSSKPQSSPATSPPPTVEEWPPSTLEGLSLQSERLSEAVFNLIDDVEIAAIKVGRGVINARLGRRVFDNHDVLGSWTVVDHMTLDANYPFYTVIWPIVGPLMGGYTLTGDVTAGFIDIRQVLPSNFRHLESLQAREEELHAFDKTATVTLPVTPEPGTGPVPVQPVAPAQTPMENPVLSPSLGQGPAPTTAPLAAQAPAPVAASGTIPAQPSAPQPAPSAAMTTARAQVLPAVPAPPATQSATSAATVPSAPAAVPVASRPAAVASPAPAAAPAPAPAPAAPPVHQDHVTTITPPARPAASSNAEMVSEWSQPFAGLEQARWSRLWNIVAFPARMPIAARWIDHIDPGEVISFLVQGTIETGPEFLYSVPNSLNIGLNGQASVFVYITGQFRISILREDARYARVRFTLLGESGTISSAGGFTDDVVHGFSVVGLNQLQNRTMITPFTVAFRHGKGRSLDKVFRFDLTTAVGRRAYTDAVQGRFAYCEEKAGGIDWRTQPRDAPVRQLADRWTIFTKVYWGTATRFGFAYRHSHESTLTLSEITARFPEIITRLFRAEVYNNRAWRFFWGLYGEFNYTFRIDVDRDRVIHHQREAASLVVRGELTDSDTSGEDLYRYMDEVESATGRHGFFPRPPKYQPTADFPTFVLNDGHDRRRDDIHSDELIEYYRSSFFYQLTFSEEQLQRFVLLPDAQRWPMLEAAFRVEPGVWSTSEKRAAYDLAHLPERVLNLPLYALNIHYDQGTILQSAESMIGSWRKAALNPNLDQRVAALGEMFADRRYSEQLVRLLRLVLAGERVSYIIQGSSHAFGYLRDAGVGTAPIDPLPEQRELIIEFDRLAARPQDDPLASIDALSMEPLDDGRYSLSFKTQDGAVPRDLYLSLMEIRPWHLPRDVGQAAYVDTEHMMGTGANVLVLSRDSGPFSDLLAKVLPGNAYVLKAAYSRDGHTWGPIAECRFFLPPSPPPPGP